MRKRPGRSTPRLAAGIRASTSCASRGAHVEVHRTLAGKFDRQAQPLMRARILDQDMKAGGISGENRPRLAGAQRDPRQVAPSMQDRDHADAGEQESENVSEAQVVIDRADQQQHQGDAQT